MRALRSSRTGWSGSHEICVTEIVCFFFLFHSGTKMGETFGNKFLLWGKRWKQMLTFTWWQSGNQLDFTQIDDGLISKECFEGDFPMRIFILSTKYTKHYVASQMELSSRWIKNKFRKYQLLPNLRSYQKWAHFGPDVQGHNRQNIKLVTTQLYAHVLSRRSSFPSGEVEPEKKTVTFFNTPQCSTIFPLTKVDPSKVSRVLNYVREK